MSQSRYGSVSQPMLSRRPSARFRRNDPCHVRLDGMRRPLLSIASIVFLAGQQGTFGQAALSVPPWLVSYPGATAQTRASAGFFESTYETAAKPEELIAHY